MPCRPPVRCERPGCRTLVYGGLRICKLHARQYDAERPSSSKRGYGRARWKRPGSGVRARFLKRHPYCADPFGVHGTRPVAAAHVDHIRPVTGPTDPTFFDPEGLQALCHSCHSRKTITERTTE